MIELIELTSWMSSHSPAQSNKWTSRMRPIWSAENMKIVQISSLKMSDYPDPLYAMKITLYWFWTFDHPNILNTLLALGWISELCYTDNRWNQYLHWGQCCMFYGRSHWEPIVTLSMPVFGMQDCYFVLSLQAFRSKPWTRVGEQHFAVGARTERQLQCRPNRQIMYATKQ